MVIPVFLHTTTNKRSTHPCVHPCVHPCYHTFANKLIPVFFPVFLGELPTSTQHFFIPQKKTQHKHHHYFTQPLPPPLPSFESIASTQPLLSHQPLHRWQQLIIPLLIVVHLVIHYQIQRLHLCIILTLPPSAVDYTAGIIAGRIRCLKAAASKLLPQIKRYYLFQSVVFICIIGKYFPLQSLLLCYCLCYNH